MEAVVTSLPNSKVAHVVCAHCDSVVPVSRLASEGNNFCCSGCEFVFQILHDQGLTDYYRYRDNAGETKPVPASPSLKSFSYLDSEEFALNNVKALDSGLSQVLFYLEGIHCTACVWLIEQLPRVVYGVHTSRLDFGKGVVTVSYLKELVSLSKIATTLDSFGYTLHSLKSPATAEAKKAEERLFLIRLGVAAVCMGNTMMLAVSLYQGMWSGMEEQYATFFRWTSLGLSLPAIFFSATPFFRSAIGSMRNVNFSIDIPISLGISVAFISSAINVVLGRTEIYFDSVCALIFFLLLGRWLQWKAIQRAEAKSRVGLSLLPMTAIRMLEGKEEEVVIEAIQVGDLIRLYPGARVPADGVIVDGTSMVDLSVLTGESEPVKVAPQDLVFSGALNIEAVVTFKVTAARDMSRMGKLLDMVEESRLTRPAIVELTNRVSQYLTAAVLILTCATFFYWMGSGLNRAFDAALSFLLVSCLCAFGLATPVALTVALGKAASRGILIKGADTIERLSKVKLVFFDKTGTLTTGTPAIAEMWRSEDVKDNVFEIASLLSTGAPNHPISRAFLVGGRTLDGAIKTTYLPGRGISGITGNGEEVFIGSIRWLASLGVNVPAKGIVAANQFERKSLTPVGLSRNGKLLCIFGVGDRIRSGVTEAMKSLSVSGRKVGIISGDVQRIALNVGAQIGISESSIFAECYPEDKVNIVSSQSCPSALVGDGLNDAPALRAAYIGIGFRGGAEACLEASDIYISKSDIGLVAETFIGADRTMRVIKRNIFLSLVYNVVAGWIAMSGHMNPLMAALLMPLSSITVILSSVLSKTFVLGKAD